MVKIVIPDDAPSVISGTQALDRIKDMGEVTVFTTPPASQDELVERIEGAHTVINIRAYCKFPAAVLEAVSGTLKHLAIWGTGIDHVDLEAARRLGIVVSNTPGANADAMAEHTLALLLAVARRIPSLDASVRRGEWTRGMLFQCKGKTLGIIGTGAIGTRVAEMARGIGMNVIAWTYHPDPAKAERFGFTYVDSLDELLARADVISLHLLGSDRTRGMIGAREFGKMKEGAIFINTARGEIVDETALVEALRTGKLLGAGLDVFAREPVEPENPLLRLPNVVLTPHTGGTTPEALSNGLMRCADNVERFLKTGEVYHRVV